MVEHDLFRKPVSTLGSSPRAGFFGIMLSAAALSAPAAATPITSGQATITTVPSDAPPLKLSHWIHHNSLSLWFEGAHQSLPYELSTTSTEMCVSAYSTSG